MGQVARLQSMLSLDVYARTIGINPLRIAGGYSTINPPGDCDDIWSEFDYQSGDKVSRQQLRAEIYRAEEDISEILGYWPAPTWIYDEQHYLHNGFRPESRGVAGAWTGQPLVHTKYGYVRAMGRRKADLVPAATVSDLVPDIITGLVAGREDLDGDGFFEWAHITITPAPTGALPAEMHVYFQETDRAAPDSDGPDPDWEIRPVRAKLVAGVMHLYIPAWCLLKPTLQYGMAAGAIDADDQASYVTVVLVYREYADNTDQIVLSWARSDASASIYTEAATADVVDDRSGMLRVYRPVVTMYCDYGAAEAAMVNYQSGRYDTLSPFWAEMIAILATTRVKRAFCICGFMADRIRGWQEDLSYSGEAGSHQVTQSDLHNRLGTCRGEALVWKRIQTMRLARAIRA